MESIVTGLVFPIIVLLIEYLVIQPTLRNREMRLLTSDSVRAGNTDLKWSNGLRLSVNHFKQNFSNFNWGLGVIKHHLVEVSDFSIGSDQAEVNLMVKVRYLLDMPRPVAVYKLRIDKVGDILQINTVSEIDPFKGRDIKVPESWLVIGAISFAIFICTNSETRGTQQRKGLVNQTPVASLWSQTTPISLDSSPVTGTVGGSQIVSYLFKSETTDQLEIKIRPGGDSQLAVLLYNQNQALVQSHYVSSANYIGGIAFFPGLNASYLILVVDTNGGGGSYELSLHKLRTPTP